MPSKNKRKGSRFEYRVRDYLVKKGFFVVRRTVSQFPDLIAMKAGQTLLIECKSRQRFNPEKPILTLLSEEERNRASDLIEQTNYPVILAYNDKHKIKFLSFGGFNIFKVEALLR